MANVGSAASGKTLIGAGNGSSPTYASIGTNSGLTLHGVVTSQGNGAFQSTAAGSTGQVLMGNSGSNPTFQSGGSVFGQTITGNSGPALSPSSGNWNLVGTGSLTAAGAGSTLTTQLTGLTNHAILVGAGTATITKLALGTAGQVLQSGGASADPVYSTATYPATAGTNGNVLTSNGTNWVSSAPSSGGITTINGDSGSATGSAVTLQAFTGGNAGATIKFAAGSSTINFNVVDVNDNLMLGRVAGNSSESGSWNIGLGTGALNALTNGSFNTCTGFTSGLLIAGGSANTAYGYTSLAGITTGVGNHVFGYLSGNAYTGAESQNILICNGGVNGESNVLRIGNNGTGSLQQNKCYISGITGATVTGTAVLCAADGQLGTIASSRRYKENIIDIPQERTVLKLRPVEFNYKSDTLKNKIFGLIAEEIHDAFPELCFYRDGEPDSVKYHELPVLLLKEIQRLNKRIENLEKKCL